MAYGRNVRLKGGRGRIWLALILAAGPWFPARAQIPTAELQARLVGQWVAAVDGEARARLMVVSAVTPRKGFVGYSLTATYTLAGEKPYALKFGEVEQSGDKITLNFTTASDAICTLAAMPDGSFVGTTKYANGQVKQLRMTSPAPPELLARVAGPWIATVEGETRKRTMVVNALSRKGDTAYSMFGNLSFADQANPSPFRGGELLEDRGELRLRFVSAATSEYVLASKPDRSLAGTATFKNGQSKVVTLVKSDPATSAVILGREEVRDLVTGKKVTWRRYRDDRHIRIDFSPDGGFKAFWRVPETNPFNTRNRYDRPGFDEGTWSIDARGSLCMKWLRPGDQTCADLFMRRHGDRLMLHRTQKSDAAVYAAVIRVE